jgi:CRP/FNR family transcriptional regulator, cyclic AMP receptor protein
MPSSAHLTHILSGLPLFEGVPADRLPAIAAMFTARTQERGEQLVEAHDETGRVYVMAAGAARVSRVGADGRSIAVAFVDTGDVFGRLPFDPASGGERVDALERCTVLRCPAGDFETMLRAEPAVALHVLANFSKRLRVSAQRIESLGSQQVPARLARVLLELSDRYGKVTATGIRVDVRITHGQLAELVATTRETLTKVAGWLRSQDIASLERRQIWIADYAALQAVAEGVRVMPGRAARGSADGK